jgi:hypothetical protein
MLENAAKNAEVRQQKLSTTVMKLKEADSND